MGLPSLAMHLFRSSPRVSTTTRMGSATGQQRSLSCGREMEWLLSRSIMVYRWMVSQCSWILSGHQQLISSGHQSAQDLSSELNNPLNPANRHSNATHSSATAEGVAKEKAAKEAKAGEAARVLEKIEHL